LRGINLGSRNRISMSKLRELLEDGGFDDVKTYLQSGNVVLASTKKEDAVRRDCQRLIKGHLGLDVDVVVRSPAELATVVQRNPLGDIATNPKRYQVSFLAAEPTAELERKLAAAAAERERLAIHGREIFAWHPEGIARSKLWALLAGRDLGVVATSRNWTTVTKLLELVEAPT
jgi:uncharacterized protein (DUF1697 family)